jgi:cell division transport system permease protein
MANSASRTTQKRIFTSHLTSIISITLVIFLLGVVGILLMSANKLSTYVKENIGFSIILNEDAREMEVKRLQKYLDATEYVKSTRYITQAEAAEELQETLGEEFVDFLGYNPLLASIEVKLYAAYTNTESIESIKKEFLANSQIKEVVYEKDLIYLVNANVHRITLILLAFSALLLIISSALINNTIRLGIHAKRFTINTMQLVGATDGFIRRPFVGRSVMDGILSSLIAICIMVGLMFSLQKQFGNIISLQDFNMISAIFVFMILLGIILTNISSFFAVNRYLRMRTDELYA